MYPNIAQYIKLIELSLVENSTPFESKFCYCHAAHEARHSLLSSHGEPNSAVLRLMVSNGVLLLCLNENDNLI